MHKEENCYNRLIVTGSTSCIVGQRHNHFFVCWQDGHNSLPIDYLKYMKNQCLVLVSMCPNNYTHELCPATLLKRLLCASQASQKIFEKPVCFRAFMVSLGFEPVPLPRMPLVHCLSLFCVVQGTVVCWRWVEGCCFWAGFSTTCPSTLWAASSITTTTSLQCSSVAC